MPKKKNSKSQVILDASEGTVILAACAAVGNSPSALTTLNQAVSVHKALVDHISPKKNVRKNPLGGKYKETTLREDVLEAEKNIGVHIKSTTRKATLILEHLKVQHPDVSTRTIGRILDEKTRSDPNIK
jgi:hypothetical protein